MLWASYVLRELVIPAAKCKPNWMKIVSDSDANKNKEKKKWNSNCELSSH